ncbi:hypothetical protein N9L02_01305 [Gammaproteobacteria bacterium]|nr:hypothetical protein [Gammaproteobacteria bacterium]
MMHYKNLKKKETDDVKEVSTNISLEFEWDAKPEYWCGTIGAIDLYLDNELQYSAPVPEAKVKSSHPVTLFFSKRQSGKPVRSNIKFLNAKHLATVKSFSLKAGIFSEKQGSTMSKDDDGVCKEFNPFSSSNS